MGWGLAASGGLKTFFPWKVAAGALLSGELSAPSHYRPSLWPGLSAHRAEPPCWTCRGPGLRWERQAGVSRRPWCLVSPQKELPRASSVLGRGGGTRQRTSRSGCRETDMTAALALWGKLAGGTEVQEADCPLGGGAAEVADAGVFSEAPDLGSGHPETSPRHWW